MKTKLIAILLLVGSGTAFSQFLSFGPQGGFNISKASVDKTIVTTDDRITFKTDNSKVGFQGGLFLRFKIGNFFLEPEAMFTSSKGQIKVNSETFGKDIVNQKYNKLDIPVLVGYKFVKLIRIEAGPLFSLLLNDDVRNIALIPELKQNYKKSTIGYQAGIGFDFWKFYLDLKYQNGLSDFGSSITIGNEKFNTTVRNPLYVVTLGIDIL